MLALYHMDWGGTADRLKAREEAWKKACEKTEGADFLGRYKPWNKRYHWTFVTKVKDLQTWLETVQNQEWESGNKETTHDEM